jgi:hypothetical protein
MEPRETDQGHRPVSLQCLSLDTADLTVSHFETCNHFAAIMNSLSNTKEEKRFNPQAVETLEMEVAGKTVQHKELLTQRLTYTSRPVFTDSNPVAASSK